MAAELLTTTAAASGTPREPAPAGDEFLNVRAVAAKVGFSVTWVYAAVRAKTFPGPVTLGYASRWSRLEIDAWMAEQRAARDARIAGGRA